MEEEQTQDIETEENQDTSLESQNDAGTTQEALEGQDEQEGSGGVKFSKEQLQQIGSMTGRLIKKQFDEGVLPLLQTQQQTAGNNSAQGGTALADFNAKLQEQIFSGDVYGAIQKVQQVTANAQANLTKQQQTETDRLITTYSDKPYYKDIYSDMKQIAKDAISKGYPPAAATELAFQTARGNHVEKKLGGGNTDTGDLEMTGGGKRTVRTKTPTLPQAFKAAAKRDIAKGLFKDEADYIANLSKTVRQQHGI